MREEVGGRGRERDGKRKEGEKENDLNNLETVETEANFTPHESNLA